MKKVIIVVVALLTVSCGSGYDSNVSTTFKNTTNQNRSGSQISVDSILSNIKEGTYREGELLVKFRPHVTASASGRVHEAIGASVIRSFSLVPSLQHVTLPEGMSVSDAIRVYMSDEYVEYAEPNYLRYAAITVPDDPFFGQQWGLRNTGLPGADINATAAWDLTKGSGSIVVAVIDTGIDYNHPDLQGNIWINPGEDPSNGVDDDGNGRIDDWRGWNFVAKNNDPMDDNGHGTHVAGITGAVGNNGVGIAGVMWSVKLLPLKILGSGGSGTIANEILAIQYAIAKKVKVMNASFSGSNFSNAEFDALNSANSAGIIFVAAAGNGGIDGVGDDTDVTPEYPASYQLPNIIAVAATTVSDIKAISSNFGDKSVHVAAPGAGILSTYPLSLQTSGYRNLSGTSMSVAFVTGLAGLLYDFYPNFNLSQVRGIIIRYVDILSSLQDLVRSGGRIDANKSLSSLRAPTGFSVTADALTQLTISWTDNATGEDRYVIERKTGGGSFIQLATLGANVQSYTDGSLTDGLSYTYRIRAFSDVPNPPSTATVEAGSAPVEASGVAPLRAPSGLQATAVSSTGINLAWTDNSQAEDGFRIERKAPGGNFVQIAATGPNASSYSDSGLESSTEYTYRVRAFSSVAGNSLYSNEASATTFVASGGSGGGGSGGCSIGTGGGVSMGLGDVFLLLVTFIFFKVVVRLPTRKAG
jgi:subtilisin family serine protease